MGSHKPPQKGSRLTDVWLHPSSRVFLGNPHRLPKARGFQEVDRAGSAQSSGHIRVLLPQRRNSRSGPVCIRLPISTAQIQQLPPPRGRTESRVPRRHPGTALREQKPPTPLHPGPQLCDSMSLLPTAPRLTTGSGRPLVKNKCNLSCPNADLFEKGRINCGGKKEIILNKCHLDYKMECELCFAQFSSSF